MKVPGFSSFVPKQFMRWQGSGKLYFIGPVEMNAVVLARAVWMKFLGGRRIIYFIDRCVKGSSIDKMWRRVLAMFDADDSMAHTGAISIEHSRWSF